MENSTCILPGGYTDENGVRHREVELRALTGREEEILASRKTQSSAALITDIISQCVMRIGTNGEITKNFARQLLVADRQFIILKLRELTFGERVRATIQCLAPGCGSKIDIDFSLHDIPVKELEQRGPAYTMELSPQAGLEAADGEIHREISFRLPNGGDQEVVSPMISCNESLALSMLLDRCVLGVGPVSNPDRELVSMLSPLARLEIEKAMETMAPRLELAMEVTCPECLREFEIPFNLQDIFFGEFRTSLDLLYREVHCLAYHYHWSEREIMEMSKQQRGKYIEVLADELERMNDGT